MTFGAPEWFWGFLLLPVLAGVFLRNELRREVLLKKLVAARLLPDLAASTSAPRRRGKFILALLGLACVNAALLQPQFGYEIREMHGRGLDVLIAVDTSKSMLSNDAQPDRLTRAKFAAQDVIDGLEGDRVGLIAFAGASFVQAPLTIDYSAVLASLQDLDTNTIPRGGTNIAGAIRQAGDAFGKGEGAHRALILFSDGEELEENALDAAKEANGKFRIFTIGVGTPAGSLIPAPGAGGATEFTRDENGQYVKSKLDEPRLKAIAEATGGFYAHLDNGTATAKAIIDQGLKRMQAGEFSAREAHPIDRYEWPLAAGILLLIASAFIRERRRVQPRPRRQPVSLATAAALLLVLLPAAHTWAMNEGLNLYDQKDYKGAYNVFQDQLERNPSSGGLEFDRGASAYKEGDYEKAMEAFGKVLASKDPALRGQAEYNLANTLVERGALQQQKDEKIKEWTGALKHYDEALKVNPKDGDAKYNADLVKKMIDELNKKQPTPPPQQQQQKQDQQKQQKQGQQQGRQQGQNQQSQQQQNQQQQNQQQQNQQQQNQQQQNQQQQNQQQQNQQQQNQQQQNQQQQGQQQQGQQQQGQQQQGQQQQGQQQQGQQQQGQQQQPGGQDQQNQQSNGPEKQNEQNQPSANQTGSMGSPSPTPSPGPGTLKENSQQDQQADARAAARAATEEAKPGEMTPSQAQALIDSMRGEDEHVNLYDRQQNRSEPPYRDW